METEQLKLDASNVKQNDLMAFIYYAKVQRTTGQSVDVLDLDNNRTMSIIGKELVENAFSADQFLKEEKVTKTQAAEILVSSPNRPLTVCFTKADGEERVLRGRLVKPEPLLGRSMVEDLDLTTGNRLRQVDHRTIQYIIVGGVKYYVGG